MGVLEKLPYEMREDDNGATPVFTGTDVPVEDFIAWMLDGGVVSGFLEEHPGLTREHIRGYMLSVLPEELLSFGETRDWL